MILLLRIAAGVCVVCAAVCVPIIMLQPMAGLPAILAAASFLAGAFFCLLAAELYCILRNLAIQNSDQLEILRQIQSDLAGTAPPGRITATQDDSRWMPPTRQEPSHSEINTSDSSYAPVLSMPVHQPAEPPHAQERAYQPSVAQPPSTPSLVFFVHGRKANRPKTVKLHAADEDQARRQAAPYLDEISSVERRL